MQSGREGYMACLACTGSSPSACAARLHTEPAGSAPQLACKARLTVRASAFFFSREWPRVAPWRRDFMTASTLTVGTTLSRFCDMAARAPRWPCLPPAHRAVRQARAGADLAAPTGAGQARGALHMELGLHSVALRCGALGRLQGCGTPLGPSPGCASAGHHRLGRGPDPAQRRGGCHLPARSQCESACPGAGLSSARLGPLTPKT